MKKNYLFLVLLASLVIVACDEDDVRPNVIKPVPFSPATPPPVGIDTISPKVVINAPAPNTMFTVIDIVSLTVTVTDNKELEEVKIILNGLVQSGGLTTVVNGNIDPPGNNTFIQRIYLSKDVRDLPKNATELSYMAIVEAKDRAQNTSKDSVTFTIHAPDLNKTEFVEASTKINLYHALDWYGYIAPKDPEDALSLVLLYMVDNDFDLHISEAQWIKFAADFGLKDQVWSTWDVNGDASLDVAEFNQGIKKLNFYTEWNIDKKSGIDEHELAAGIFGRWDHDKSGLLSREEYEDKFYTYYASE